MFNKKSFLRIKENFSFDKKAFLSLASLFFILFSLILTLGFFNKRQTFSKKAQEDTFPEKPEYAKGEVIFKLRTQQEEIRTKNDVSQKSLDNKVPFTVLEEKTIPDNLKKINQDFGIRSIEKVVKGSQDFEIEASSFKTRTSKETPFFTKKDLSKIYKISFDENNSVEEVVERLNSDPQIAYAEPNYILKANYYPNDSLFKDLWGLNNTGQNQGKPDADIDLPEAWDISTGSAQVIVGVIDTGIDYNHEDLQDSLWQNPGEIPDNHLDDDNNGYVDDVWGWNFVSQNNNPMDDAGHGTHVSGIIGATMDNLIGVAGIVPKVKLMSLKFLNSQGSGFTSDAISAISYATKMGVKITNNSWGGGGFSIALNEAIAEARDAGSLFVAAAGNEGHDNDKKPSYPASYLLSNIISVSSTNYKDELSSFSNYGISSVDVVAPGEAILSTLTNNSYGLKSGTSMAAPHVTGLSALLQSYDPSLSSLEMKSLIETTTEDLGLTGRDVTFSSGRINAAKAIQALKENLIPPVGEIEFPLPTAFIGGVVEVIGSVGGRSFASYNIELGQGINPSFWSNKGIVLPNNGTTPVNNDVIATFDSTVLESGKWTIKLTVLGNNGINLEKNILVEIDGSLRSGWPKDLNLGNLDERDKPYFIAEDLNNDGKKEIVGASFDGNVYVWSEKGELIPGWPKYLGGDLYGSAYSVPAIADFNNDGNKEILIKAYKYYFKDFYYSEMNLHLLDYSGSELPGWPIIGYFNDPIIEEFDGNLNQIIAYDFSEEKLKIINNDGFFKKISLSNGGSNYMSVADLNQDGLNDVVFAKDEEIIAYKNNGTLLWKKSLGNQVSWAKPTIADIDLDGKKEIIVTSDSASGSIYENGKIWVFKNDGNLLAGWPKTDYITGNTNRSSVAIGDVDNDGVLELVFGTSWGRVYIYSSSGNLENIIYVEPEANINRGVALADINNDGLPEIIFGSSPGSYLENGFFAYNYKGKIIPGWPKKVFIYSTPQVVDLDSDGRAEVIGYGRENYYSSDKLFVFNTNSDFISKNNHWPMYGFNQGRSSNWFFVGTLPTLTPTIVPTIVPSPTPIANAGQAFYFPPDSWENKNYLYLKNKDTSFKAVNEFTFEFWLRPEMLEFSSDPGHFSYREFLLILADMENPEKDLGTILLYIPDQQNVLLPLEAKEAVVLDGSQWTHISVTKKDKEIKLFVNGGLKDSIIVPGELSNPEENFLNLGQYYYFGAIDEVRLSNVARNVEEDWQNNLYFNPLVFDQNTLGLWRLDGNLKDEGGRFDLQTAGVVSYSAGRVAYPAPTPTPTIIPKPTKPPVPNSAPTILTESLPNGKKLSFYSTTITGEDQNTNDDLSMTATGLPAGIKLGACKTTVSSGKKQINCVLSGRTLISTKKTVEVTLKDSARDQTQKSFTLWIQ